MVLTERRQQNERRRRHNTQPGGQRHFRGGGFAQGQHLPGLLQAHPVQGRFRLGRGGGFRRARLRLGLLFLHQVIQRHPEQPAQGDRSFQIRQGLAALPFGNRLTGDLQPGCKLLLRKARLPAQFHQLFRKCHPASSCFLRIFLSSMLPAYTFSRLRATSFGLKFVNLWLRGTKKRPVPLKKEENGPRIVRSRRSSRQIRSDYSKSPGIRMTFLGHLLTQVPQPVHLE